MMGKETICQLAKTVTGKMFEQQPKCIKLLNMKTNDFFFVKRKMNTSQHIRDYLACLEFL